MYPVTFISAVFVVLATNEDKQGDCVDNAFGYGVDLTQCYLNCKRSDIRNGYSTNFMVGYTAIGV